MYANRKSNLLLAEKGNDAKCHVFLIFQFQMRNLDTIKLAFCIHSKHMLPHGFIGERHELPREIRVQLEQSGPMRISPKGMIHKTIHRAVLNLHSRMNANMSH